MYFELITRKIFYSDKGQKGPLSKGNCVTRKLIKNESGDYIITIRRHQQQQRNIKTSIP